MSTSSPIPGGRFFSPTFGFYARNGYFGSPQARVEAERIASLGFNWVCIVATVLQDTVASTRQYRDFRMTPADDELRDIIDVFHAKGVRVQLRPMLECWDGTQRIHIHFPDEGEIIPGKPINHWTRWFDSLVERTLHYGALAQRAGCEAFGIDSELDQTVRQHAHWLRVIAAARSVYSGHLTNGFTRNYVDFRQELRDHPDHWFKELDSLGCSFYTPLADGPGATIEQMLERIQKEVVYYRETAALYGKPFYLAECGCCSTAGATVKPWGWDNPGGYDGDEQARFLETVLRAFWDEPWWGGLLWWKWEEQNDRPWLLDDPRGEKGFSVWGKPAAEVFKQWSCKLTS